MVTDLPIFAFYTDMPVDSHLLVISEKTLATKIITADDFLRVINSRHPELVLLARFPNLKSQIVPHLQKDYSVGYSDDTGARLYVLKGIKKQV